MPPRVVLSLLSFYRWFYRGRPHFQVNASKSRKERHGARILHYLDVICVTWAPREPFQADQTLVLCVASLELTNHSWLIGNSDPSWQIVALLVICARVFSIVGGAPQMSKDPSGGVCVCPCTCSVSPHISSALLKCRQFLHQSFPGLAGG